MVLCSFLLYRVDLPIVPYYHQQGLLSLHVGGGLRAVEDGKNSI
jgi:hypothetical protein